MERLCQVQLCCLEGKRGESDGQIEASRTSELKWTLEAIAHLKNSHFIDEKIEAWRGQQVAPNLQSPIFDRTDIGILILNPVF